LEANLRKNILQGNGKARATGFAIPVLGRLPKIFTDTYLLKCKLQLALRIIDLGTENSLRICIGKPCGGVRPLTVGHDDNVFLNGLAQQALQAEIARLDILPENICSYQKGKGCSNATIVSCVTKEVALQSNKYYLAEISDDAEKMFDCLHIELQVALLQLAGVGVQGFVEWQCANLTGRTNRLITDIFVTTLQYQFGLPQGNGFSVEIANLYALFLLIWWSINPVQQTGTIAPFNSPRHAFPLIADNTTKYVSSVAYVDDATRFVAALIETCSVMSFFAIVQGYCNLLADLSLVIKMGRNVKKCYINLYNIPEDTEIPEFHSIAWSYDAQGPVKGVIETTVMRHESDSYQLLCYQVDDTIKKHAPHQIKSILTTRKYLGVAMDAQLDDTEGKRKLIKKLYQRIELVAAKMNSIREAQIAQNMLVCQVATFSPICISMMLQDCEVIDKTILKSYHHWLKLMAHDAKHSVFISGAKGGIGIDSFTSQYICALLRDLEVYISNDGSLPAHALKTSLEEATKQTLWMLFQDGNIPTTTQAYNHVQTYPISRKKTTTYFDTFNQPNETVLSYNHTHCMAKAIHTTSALGFMLQDFNHEFISRFVGNLAVMDKFAKPIADRSITNRAHLGACLRDGNRHFHKYSILGHICLF
jgi:hypothetical protein